MLSEEQKTAYLVSELSWGKVTVAFSRGVQNISCRQCKKRWKNVYALVRIEEDEWDMRRREVRPKSSSV
jgi:hypothetical protein